jgi:hypothetical protein
VTEPPVTTGPPDPCIPSFENGTPMVTGNNVLVDLSDCVVEAFCQVATANSVSCKLL